MFHIGIQLFLCIERRILCGSAAVNILSLGADRTAGLPVHVQSGQPGSFCALKIINKYKLWSASAGNYCRRQAGAKINSLRFPELLKPGSDFLRFRICLAEGFDCDSFQNLRFHGPILIIGGCLGNAVHNVHSFGDFAEGGIGSV